MDVKKVLLRTFFGCPKEGVYSPSVQSTLYDMAKAALGRFSLYFHSSFKQYNANCLVLYKPTLKATLDRVSYF